MKEIKVWKTKDGNIYEDRGLAELHERATDYFDAVKDLVEKNINGTYGATQDEVIDFVMDNSVKLLVILTHYKDV